MKLNKFRITGLFFFEDGQVKKVDWVEGKLVKKAKQDGQEVQVPLNKAEVEVAFSKMFKEYSEQGKTYTVKNSKGQVSFIPFSKVFYATLEVEQIEDIEIEEVPTAPAPPKSLDEVKPRVSSIENHPAFTKPTEEGEEN